jgi:hypothetical protein
LSVGRLPVEFFQQLTTGATEATDWPLFVEVQQQDSPGSTFIL